MLLQLNDLQPDSVEKIYVIDRVRSVLVAALLQIATKTWLLRPFLNS